MAETDDVRVWRTTPSLGSYYGGFAYTTLIAPPTPCWIGDIPVLVHHNKWTGSTFIGVTTTANERDFPARHFPTLEAAKAALLVLRD
jgi:hypothetical protein